MKTMLLIFDITMLLLFVLFVFFIPGSFDNQIHAEFSPSSHSTYNYCPAAFEEDGITRCFVGNGILAGMMVIFFSITLVLASNYYFGR